MKIKYLLLSFLLCFTNISFASDFDTTSPFFPYEKDSSWFVDDPYRRLLVKELEKIEKERIQSQKETIEYENQYALETKINNIVNSNYSVSINKKLEKAKNSNSPYVLINLFDFSKKFIDNNKSDWESSQYILNRDSKLTNIKIGDRKLNYIYHKKVNLNEQHLITMILLSNSFQNYYHNRGYYVKPVSYEDLLQTSDVNPFLTKSNIPINKSYYLLISHKPIVSIGLQKNYQDIIYEIK